MGIGFGWLKKTAMILAKVAAGAMGVGELLKADLPQLSPGLDILAKIQAEVLRVEAFAESWGDNDGTGEKKLQAVTALAMDIILKSDLYRGYKPEDEELFRSDVQGIVNHVLSLSKNRK